MIISEVRGVLLFRFERYWNLILLVLVLAGCGAGYEQSKGAGAESTKTISFERTSARILTRTGEFILQVEIADSPKERAKGLMQRQTLPEDAGMLFIYNDPQPSKTGFWMFRTRIPLDIAFIGPEGEILAIEHMAPCTSQSPRGCPTYSPGVEYWAALEVNQGYFAARGITPGALLQVESGKGWGKPSSP